MHQRDAIYTVTASGGSPNIGHGNQAVHDHALAACTLSSSPKVKLRSAVHLRGCKGSAVSQGIHGWHVMEEGVFNVVFALRPIRLLIGASAYSGDAQCAW